MKILSAGGQVIVGLDEDVAVQLGDGQSFVIKLIRFDGLLVRPSGSQMSSEHIGSSHENGKKFVRYTNDGGQVNFTVLAAQNNGSYTLGLAA